MISAYFTLESTDGAINTFTEIELSESLTFQNVFDSLFSTFEKNYTLEKITDPMHSISYNLSDTIIHSISHSGVTICFILKLNT